VVDFNKITNEKDFQRLVNHLFAIECNSPAFIPSSPYIGFDKGWDGRFEGFYPFDNMEGIFSIQSKWTLKNFNEAETYLRQEIAKEIKKAVDNKVDHLRIATQAELRADQVKSLQDLKSDSLKSLHIWHRENLKIRIERQPFLRNFYFGDPQHPMLTPADVYFAILEKQLSDISASEIPSFQKYITSIREFMLNQNEQILIIHAPGGFGKSHLLKELASTAYGCDQTRQLWMIKPGYHNFESAIQSEVDPQKKYILVLDDADRSLQTLNPLLAFAKYSGVSIKVILGARTSGIHILHESIRQLKATERLKEFKIDEWPKDDLLKLLRLTAQKDSVQDEEIIVNDFQNPYFIVLIGNRIRGKEQIDFKKLKAKILDDIIQDTKTALKSLFQERIDEFLIHLSCVVPFSVEDKRMLESIGQEIDQSGDKIKKAIKLLLDSNILRQVGKSIRFAPDMRGDIYLLYKLEDLDKEYFKDIVTKWIPICSKNVFVNLGSTLKYGQDNIIATILEEFVNEWISKAKDTNGTDRIEKLKWLENVVSYVPTQCIELLNAYFDTTPPTETSILNPDEPHIVQLDKDDYGPVIVGLIRNQSHREDVVKIIQRLDELNLGGTYDNYKAHTLIKECVSPLRNRIQDVLETLNILDGWLKTPTRSKASLIKSALSEVLAASHEYTRSFLDKMEFGERHLKNTPPIVEMRDKALSIVKTMLFLDDINFQTDAIDVCEHIGSTRMGMVPAKDMPLAARFVEERKAIIGEISKLVKPDADFRLLSDIEDMLLGWWARETQGSENAIPLLRSFPKNPEYEIFRFFSSRVEILEDFTELEAKAPQTKRWSWLVENVMQKKWKMTAKDFIRPVQELDQKYTTATEIVEFLSEFNTKLSYINIHTHPYFITCWVQIDTDVFKKIRIDKNLWDKLSERFKSSIDYALAEIDNDHIGNIANEVLQNIDNATIEQVGTLLGIVATKFPQNWKNWLTALIKRGSDDVIKMVVRELYFIHKQDQNIDAVVELLLLAMRNVKNAKKDFIDSVAFVLTSLKMELHQHKDIKKLVDCLYDLIKDRPKLEWDDEEIIEFCITELEGLIKFIGYRLNKSKENSSYSRFEAIPYDGLKHLKDSVQSYDDYEKLMVKALEWHNTYSRGVEHYEVQKILKPVLMSRDLPNNILYADSFVNKLLQENKINSALTCAQYLPLHGETSDLFLKIAGAGVKEGRVEEIESLLFTKTMPEGGWTSSHNQPPPALVQKKKVYESMQNKTSGVLENLLRRCVNSIEKSIQDNLDRDKEFLAER
jgi:hypothetical protein